MGKFLKRTKLPLWIACFAILLNALAPSISHALSGMQDKANLTEVCSTSGAKFVSVDLKTSGQSQPGSNVHHWEHCPFCATHSGTFALPATTTTHLATFDGHDVFPPLFYHSPSPLFSWSRANPRAPPLFS